MWELPYVSLIGLEIQQPAKSTRSRSDHMDAVRYRMENQTVSQGPPSRVKALRELQGGWPALTKGEARYLHQVRSTLRRQFSILRELPGAQQEQFFTFLRPHRTWSSL